MQLSDFGNVLLRQNVRPAKGTVSVTQANEGEVIKVKKLEISPYKALYCWYNCKAHALKYGGEVIYGWSLNFKNEMYQAQCHAVWLSLKGEYIDVTPDHGTCQPDLDTSLKINVDFVAVPPAADSVGKFTTL